MSRVLPVLFNTDMVRAILDGRKGATRRIVKGVVPKDAIWGYTAFTPKGCISCRGTFADGYGEKFFRRPCQKGDILYVRETWCTGYDGEAYFYRADKNTERRSKLIDYDIRIWRPSIHMPKEAARIWLNVTDVRVERLQDITGQGVRAEGILTQHGNPAMGKRWENLQRLEFEKLWNSTIKKSDKGRYGWEANPWVWVIEFERCRKPETR